MEVLILGGGPSGLLAAWAVLYYGHKPVIFERFPKKPDGKTSGIFYLHDSCELPIAKTKIDIIPVGAPMDKLKECYRQKVYGTDDENIEVSIPLVRRSGIAYNGSRAMELLWDILEPFILKVMVNGWNNIELYSRQYCKVVNTIPLNKIYNTKLPFVNSYIYTSDAPMDEAYMMYNANQYIHWYRASAIFGRFSLEFTPGYIPNMEGGGYHQVTKVIPAPNMLPTVENNVLLTGRYGSWNKSMLSHDVFYNVLEWLQR